MADNLLLLLLFINILQIQLSSKPRSSVTVDNLQLDALRVGVADADFDASELIVSNLQRDDAVDLEILKAALAAGS